jgi:hypothetical protein
MPVAFLCVAFLAGIVHAGYPVHADGDLAPLGAPDGQLNTGDCLVASRIIKGCQSTFTSNT